MGGERPYQCKYFSATPLPYNTLCINILQYPLFYIAKEPVLLSKRAYIAAQNRHFCIAKPILLFSAVIFFTKQEYFPCKVSLISFTD
jgi:hypothetical protein